MAGEDKGKSKIVNKDQAVLQGFEELRQRRDIIASKIAELENERKEHEMVMETLKEVDPDRKCFRMVGGVLVERTVKEVLPALTDNYEKIGEVIQNLNSQLQSQMEEINKYVEKYKIPIGIRPGDDEKETTSVTDKGDGKTTGVLVAEDS